MWIPNNTPEIWTKGKALVMATVTSDHKMLDICGKSRVVNCSIYQMISLAWLSPTEQLSVMSHRRLQSDDEFRYRNRLWFM